MIYRVLALALFTASFATSAAAQVFTPTQAPDRAFEDGGKMRRSLAR